MSSVLPLDKMTPAEKLEAIEILWADLCAHEAEMPVPSWQAEILLEREAAVARGEQVPVDWERAKQQLDERLRCR